jgi:hypothetical protein
MALGHARQCEAGREGGTTWKFEKSVTDLAEIVFLIAAFDEIAAVASGAAASVGTFTLARGILSIEKRRSISFIKGRKARLVSWGNPLLRAGGNDRTGNR